MADSEVEGVVGVVGEEEVEVSGGGQVAQQEVVEEEVGGDEEEKKAIVRHLILSTPDGEVMNTVEGRCHLLSLLWLGSAVSSWVGASMLARTHAYTHTHIHTHR